MSNKSRLLVLWIALAAGLTPRAPVLAQKAMDQTEMNEETAKAFVKSDKKLNAIYQKLIAKISPEGQARLREVEKVWLQFRDLECEFETVGTEGGSIHPLVLLNCKTRLTDRRVEDLETQLNCQEGDLSCGGQ